MSLHDDIMRLPCEYNLDIGDEFMGYKLGHRDARHAAAELALKADARIEELESALKMLLNALPLNLDWLDPDIERFAKALLKADPK
jgi:hypothetical protein